MANINESKKIEVSYLRRMGMLRQPCTITVSWNSVSMRLIDNPEDTLTIQSFADNQKIELAYMLVNKEGEEKEIRYKVKLTRNKANLRGYRYYFICPLSVQNVYCGRRAAVLYRPQNGQYFGCRYCHEIKYLTQIYNQRHSQHSEAKRLIIERKIEALEECRKMYGGKKTRKQIRLEKLTQEARKYPSLLW
jgi:hypothetical protein